MLANIVSVGHRVNFAVLLLLLFASWLSSNCVALRLAGHMSDAIAAVPDKLYSQPKPSVCSGPVGRYGLLAEYRQLFVRHEELTVRTIKLSHAAMENKRETEVGRLAAQVAHDIRSPLTALEITMKDSHGLPEETRLLTRAAIQRVQDIANTLLTRSRGKKDETRVGKHLLAGIISSVLSEKRAKTGHRASVVIDFVNRDQACLEHVECNATEVARAISNLVENSIEAVGRDGKVEVSLEHVADQLIVTIKDNGPGIPPELLPSIGKKGATFGKSQGNGLGIYGANEVMRNLGGELDIASTVGLGTSICLRFPRIDPPDWFLTSLDIKGVTDIVAVDDDITIHKVWADRFSIRQAKGIQVHHLSSPDDLIEWCRAQPATAGQRFLIDFEFAEDPVTGVDLVEQLDLASKALLVSSRVEEPLILAKLGRLNLRALPKQVAPHVPIVNSAA